MRYTTKKVQIDAVQWTGDNLAEIVEFTENCFNAGKTWAEVYDYLQETWVNVNHRDYIIKGTKQEFYPCAEDVFDQKYEPTDLGLCEGDMLK